MHADEILTPAIERLIHTQARRVCKSITASDPSQARQDLVQELRMVVLECARTFRGENGAQLATYAFAAIRLHAWRKGADIESPVHVAKNKKRDVWGKKTGVTQSLRAPDRGTGNAANIPNDPMDSISGDLLNPEQSLMEELDRRELIAQVHAVIRGLPAPEAVARVLLHEEPARTVARAMGMPVGGLRKAITRTKRALQADPRLRVLFLQRTRAMV